jgi:hypothetical protein
MKDRERKRERQKESREETINGATSHRPALTKKDIEISEAEMQNVWFVAREQEGTHSDMSSGFDTQAPSSLPSPMLDKNSCFIPCNNNLGCQEWYNTLRVSSAKIYALSCWDFIL